MAKFNGYVVTEAGRNLIAKGLTGDTVIFTKMQLGDGTTSNDGRTMTALVSTKADLPIIGLSNTGTGIAELRFLINNKDITTGFYIKEVGVFAKGADGVEVLYAYNVSPNPDFIPPFSANNIIEIEYVDSIIVDQVANITASIDPSITYMTQAQISSTYVKKTDIATQTEVNNGLEDTKIVTSKRLKARLDSLLSGITSTYVLKTDLATETTSGITKYGTKENTALEGYQIARILGIDDLYYGGLISTNGLKIKGKAYYDSNTKQIYLCKENNNLNYIDLSKFTAFSNKSLLDKLENLSEVKLYSIDSRLTVGGVYKIGKMCILSLDSNELYNGKNHGDVLFNVPVGYRPKYLTPAPVGFIGSNSSGAVHIETNGNAIWRGVNNAPTAMYINATYIVAD